MGSVYYHKQRNNTAYTKIILSNKLTQYKIYANFNVIKINIKHTKKAMIVCRRHYYAILIKVCVIFFSAKLIYSFNACCIYNKKQTFISRKIVKIWRGYDYLFYIKRILVISRIFYFLFWQRKFGLQSQKR